MAIVLIWLGKKLLTISESNMTIEIRLLIGVKDQSVLARLSQPNLIVR